MQFILDHQSWLLPLVAGMLANAFPALPWGKLLSGIIGAMASNRGK